MPYENRGILGEFQKKKILRGDAYGPSERGASHLEPSNPLNDEHDYQGRTRSRILPLQKNEPYPTNIT